MKALGFDTAALDKFDPGQPRVPAGSGSTIGQWTDDTCGAAGESRVTIGGQDSGGAAGDRENAWSSSPTSVPIADDGRVKPGGRGLSVAAERPVAPDILELIAARHVGYDVDVELLL